MFYCKKLNNCITNIYDHVVTVAFMDCNKSFHELLEIHNLLDISPKKLTNSYNRDKQIKYQREYGCYKCSFQKYK